MNSLSCTLNVFNVSLKRKTLLLLSFFLCCSCQTTTILFQEQKNTSISLSPDYRKAHHFFLGSLVETAEVDATQICGSREVLQMQTQITYLDMLWPFLIGTTSGITLSFALTSYDSAWLAGLIAFLIGVNIYQPKTVKVWCAPENVPSHSLLLK